MSSPSVVESIFFAAFAKGTPEDRAAYLDEACGGDDDLRRRVERLLSAQRDVGSFLEPSPAGSGTVEHRPAECAGSRIGPYKLLQEIGEGGMGVVFMAEQEKPVRRRVALKIIKPGMDSAQVIARFEAERQALAMMDHQNIARVLDAGTTDSGRPYFVMELVHGVPITKYCDDNHLTPRERLELFVPVCQAIQHAHHKGVIHRDVKPSNVMVCLYDGKPVPKVIDFGVAKAVEQRLTERTMFTQYGAIVGTFEYMSPEQSEMSQLGVDTRSDIYSLGVLLYELLTGTTPLERKRVRAAALDEVLRLIREEEPPKPSTRITQSQASLANLAAQRKTEPAKLSRLMRGELDWIVMKALEKDRTRRYETANGFARDVQRYLTDEPVEACPPSASYKLRKLARKYKTPLRVAGAFAVLLIAGVVVSVGQAVRATLAEEHARAERDRAVAAEERAQDEAQKAQTEAAIATAVSDFLQKDLLAQANPGVEPDRDLTLRALLDRAAQKIEGKFSQQPLIEASIRQTIARTCISLSLFAAAQPHLERALELRRRHLGDEHRDTLKSMSSLAVALHEQSRYAEAEAFYRKALVLSLRVLGDEDSDTAVTMYRLAFLLQTRGERAEAEVLMKKALAIHRLVNGEEHLLTLQTMSTLTELQQWRRTLSPVEAEQVLRRILETRRRVQGNEHPATLLAMHHLANPLRDQGKLDEAERLSREGLDIARRVLTEEHQRTLLLRNGLCETLSRRGDYAKAEPLLVENLEALRRVGGEEHAVTLNAMDLLTEVYRRQGKHDQAEPLAVKRVELTRRVHRAEHPDLAQALTSLGRVRLEQQKFAEAEPVLRECLAIRATKLPNWQFFRESLLGRSLLGQQRYAEAEPLLQTGFAGLKQHEATIPQSFRPRSLTEAIEWLVQLSEATGKPDDAAKWRKELEAVKATVKPPAP